MCKNLKIYEISILYNSKFIAKVNILNNRTTVRQTTNNIYTIISDLKVVNSWKEFFSLYVKSW